MNPFRQSQTRESLQALESLGMLTVAEGAQLRQLIDDPALDACLARAETLHVHVKVDDTQALAVEALAAAGAVLDHRREGFVKYRLHGRVNAIFSHIAVSEDDLVESASSRRPRPFLDHVGIDVRSTDDASRAAFDALPAIAAARQWRWVPQGGDAGPVRCCHVEVSRKHWLFPAGARPIEIACGPLRENSAGSGCDLRPAQATTAQPPRCAARPVATA